MYRIVRPLRCTPDANMALYVSCTSIKKIINKVKLKKSRSAVIAVVALRIKGNDDLGNGRVCHFYLKILTWQANLYVAFRVKCR